MMRLFLFVLFLASFTGAAAAQGGAKPINFPQPVFPSGSSDDVYGDDIVIGVRVDKEGKVSEAQALRQTQPCSDPYKDPTMLAIRKAAIDAAKASTFEPVLQNGKPSEVELKVTYRLKHVTKASGEKRIAEAGVLNGKALSLPRPQYSAAARAHHTSGDVAIKMLIGESGKVLSIEVLSGNPDLIAGTIDSACHAEFAPVILHGQPIRISGVVTYHFIP